MSKTTLRLAPALCLLLAACSGTNPDREYGEVKAAPPLEVPPGLDAPDTRGALPAPEWQGSGEQALLPEVEGAHIARDGAERWLVVEQSAEELWPKLLNFWGEIGLELERNDPRLGLMETGWAESNRDLPKTWLRSVMPNLYSAPYRDKYRLRLERGSEPGSSEIFITHYRAEEVSREDVLQERSQSAWEERPSDPERAYELYRRLMIYIGVPKAQATRMVAAETQAPVAESRQPDAVLQEEGDSLSLVLNDGFARAWRRGGIALDRIGLVVDDRDRSRGLYYVTVVGELKVDDGEGGWFSGIFSGGGTGGERKYQVKLGRDDDESTPFTVLDANGAPLSAREARPLLEQLREQFNQ